ncbi:TetR/AcrR family transcriptional regulator [Bacillus sp. FJAT-49732]|uniref:TetR/AcrR family transcriptional regulator n=1 Tax=Lederbergia citrisecunda TaxID=2833583 RepID=A0A942TRP0_9BACI|nr:TetR/AcrR family transcriptional regulator [Lederbergia citrisecunda]MBS4201009.1 TetR/AcrR family transcriptional regulator [Lederbergia citrisecunda]
MSDNDLMMEHIFDKENFTEKQKKIIEAAIDLFSEKGYASTSTSEIAKKAGVAEGTIFRHYKTKKELLMSIVMPLITRLVGPIVVNDLNKVFDRQYDHVEDFLTALIENRKAILIKLLPIIKIILQEIPFQAELKSHIIEHFGEKAFNLFLNKIKIYQEKGQLIDMPPTSLARLMLTNMFGYLFSRYILFPNYEWDDELETERTIQSIMHGLGKKE